jgi:isocitrate dehydrogenase
LGEFLALAASLEHLAGYTGNRRASVLATALDEATGEVLEHGKSPARKLGQLDNRGSHFYLALYWAKAMASQTDHPVLAARFSALTDDLAKHEAMIVDELTAVQGSPVDIGGYYLPDPGLTSRAMRPSDTFNRILDAFLAGLGRD